MFAVNIRFSKIKLILFICAAVVMAVLIIAVYNKSQKQQAIKPVCNNEQEIISYIASFGVTVATDSVKVDTVIVPSEFNEVYTNYNKLQIEQGFDLTKYKGKQLTRYTFSVTNYSQEGFDVFAEILLYDNKVVAADVYSTNVDGFIKALK